MPLFSLTPNFFSFIMNGCWIVPHSLSASVVSDHVISLPQPVDMVHTADCENLPWTFTPVADIHSHDLKGAKLHQQNTPLCYTNDSFGVPYLDQLPSLTLSSFQHWSCPLYPLCYSELLRFSDTKIHVFVSGFPPLYLTFLLIHTKHMYDVWNMAI